mmetsp:Transcript_148504/g.262219  ORF Transcript_148504/g.262219 Transcript_148504/m.262219 type:complete len:350 (-) Transcript_148504:16-1065(-)
MGQTGCCSCSLGPGSKDDFDQIKSAGPAPVGPSKVPPKDADQPDNSDAESARTEDDEEFERQVEANLRRQSTRQAVSAGVVDIPANWKPPVYQKTAQQEARITSVLERCFLFSALEKPALAAIIKAFKEHPVSGGTHVIEQGAEVGPNDAGLFIVESGRLEVFKGTSKQPVCTYDGFGQHFGELALLYRAPRAATVVAVSDSLLWSIDGHTFNALVRDAAEKAQLGRVNFLKSVLILSDLSADELAALSENLEVRHFTEGQLIMQEGDADSDLYILQNGRAAAMRGDATIKVYGPGDYFGELAILKSAPRAVDIVAGQNCVALAISAAAFTRLLGGIRGRLEQEAAHYT